MEKKRKKPWQFGKLAMAGVLSAAMVLQPVTGLVARKVYERIFVYVSAISPNNAKMTAFGYYKIKRGKNE